MSEKIIVSSSGGKDSILALSELIKNKDYEISALLMTITEDYDRVSMHGIRRILLEQQAKSLGFHLEKVTIAKDISKEEYESKMQEALIRYQAKDVCSVAFGDIFLEDLRKYREGKLSKIGMKAIFPLWGKDTIELSNTFIDLGFEAVITCVDSQALDKKFVGRQFSKEFLSELPSGVDPCGENGEFHSFVYDGPIFKNRVPYTIGGIVFRDNRFYYCDLIPIR